jgi:hypothetical protein
MSTHPHTQRRQQQRQHSCVCERTTRRSCTRCCAVRVLGAPHTSAAYRRSSGSAFCTRHHTLSNDTGARMVLRRGTQPTPPVSHSGSSSHGRSPCPRDQRSSGCCTGTTPTGAVRVRTSRPQRTHRTHTPLQRPRAIAVQAQLERGQELGRVHGTLGAHVCDDARASSTDARQRHGLQRNAGATVPITAKNGAALLVYTGSAGGAAGASAGGSPPSASASPPCFASSTTFSTPSSVQAHTATVNNAPRLATWTGSSRGASGRGHPPQHNGSTNKREGDAPLKIVRNSSGVTTPGPFSLSCMTKFTVTGAHAQAPCWPNVP